MSVHAPLLAAHFADAPPGHVLPGDDHAGTAALAGRSVEDNALYARFCSTFDERIERYLALTPEQRLGGVAEPRRVLGGPPASPVIAAILT